MLIFVILFPEQLCIYPLAELQMNILRALTSIQRDKNRKDISKQPEISLSS